MRGPLILVNQCVVGAWLEDATSLREYDRLFIKHGSQLSSIVIRRWPSDSKQKIAKVLARLSGMRTIKLALTIDATFHDALLNRSLDKLLNRSHGIFVYRDLHDFSDRMPRRWFKRFSAVMVGAPAIRSLWFLHFPVDSDEVRLLRRYAVGRACGHHRFAALFTHITARRFLSRVPTNALAYRAAVWIW